MGLDGLPGEAALDAALRNAPALAGGIFPIQGPPGAGKTHTGARMICALVRAGKSVGITANSHKVIRNLLDGVIEASAEMGVDVSCMQKVGEIEPIQPQLRFTKDNPPLLAAIGTTCQVAAATAWFWARPDAAATVDVLFIDEAAQMSLANVLAVSQAARTVVLLGDPQQLDQPMQGSHPEGTDVSALHHILDGHQTIPADRGLFLEETWRLHPSICSFTSELFYEGRLHARPGLEQQDLIADCRVNGTGLRYLPVPHEGNQNASAEEADCIRGLAFEILAAKPKWIDRKGEVSAVGLADILIIAPYNAQVFELQDRLPGARIGTVDKFQGQEAPIVTYSMTTSSWADAPRGMEFLYSLKSAQRRDLAREMHLHPRSVAVRVRSTMSDTSADAACQRLCPLSRVGRALVGRHAANSRLDQRCLAVQVSPLRLPPAIRPTTDCSPTSKIAPA